MRQTHHLDQIRTDEISNLAIEHKLYLLFHLMFCGLEAEGERRGGEGVKEQKIN